MGVILVPCGFSKHVLFRERMKRWFWGYLWMGEPKKTPSLKSVAHPAIMKLGTVILYLKRSKKNINHMTHYFSSVDISIFSPEISKYCYIKKYIIYTPFNLFCIFKDLFNRHFLNFDDVSKSGYSSPS